MITTAAFIRQSSLLRRFPGLFSQAVVSKSPVTLSAALSSSLAKSSAVTPPSHQCGLLTQKDITALTVRGASTQISETPPSFARRYYWERVWALGMFPLFPAALFIHTPAIDYLLATTVALHIHWGMEATVEDYARPFVIGEMLAKLSHYALYAFSLLMYIGLLHFNYTDVGITKAFEMIWSL